MRFGSAPSKRNDHASVTGAQVGRLLSGSNGRHFSHGQRLFVRAGIIDRPAAEGKEDEEHEIERDADDHSCQDCAYHGRKYNRDGRIGTGPIARPTRLCYHPRVLFPATLADFIRTSFRLAFEIRSYRAGWRALRAPSLVIAAVSCALGVALAFQAGKGDWINALAVMVAGLALQAGVNLVNDFFEFMQGKVDDKVRNLGFTRADRITLEWLVFLVGLAFFGLAGLVGLFIAWRTGWPVIVLGVVGFLGGFFYTGEPLNYKRRGLAVPIVFFLMGVIMISGSYYAVARDFSWDIVAVSVPVSFLVSLILLTNELRDFEADVRYGIRTLAVRIGYGKAIRVYCVLLLLAYCTPALLAADGLFPHLRYLYFALPFTIPPFLLMRRPASRRAPIIPAVMLHHLAYGALFCLSYFAPART